MITSMQTKLAVIFIIFLACLSGCEKSQQSAHSSLPMPQQFDIGGTVSGLSSSGLILQLNGKGDLTISANGKFSFANPLNNNVGYAITVKSQPSVPINQTCTVSQGNGELVGHPIDNVSITCATNSYVVGGTVSGLTRKGLVLQLKGEKEIAINKNGNFIFPNVRLLDGSNFAASIKKTPHGKICIIETKTSISADGTFNIVAVKCAKKMHRK
jgi:hypothetical protein